MQLTAALTLGKYLTASHRYYSSHLLSGAALTVLILLSSGTAGAMGESECSNLKALLTHGPDYDKLKGEGKALGDGIFQYALLADPIPFERCDLFNYPYNDPTVLECRISVPLSANGVMTYDINTYLKTLLSGIAKDIAGCIGGRLPPVKTSKPFYRQPAELDRFVWAFTTTYHGPSPDRAVGVWLWMLIPKVGADLKSTTKIEIEAHFNIIMEDEVTSWGQKSGS